MNKKNKIHIAADLKTDIKKFSVEVSKQMAKYIREEMLISAYQSIMAFYSDYKPLSYKRHYYNFLENSFRGYYKNPHNQIIRGGIELTPYMMDDIYKGSDDYKKKGGNITDYVFNLVYSGYHGNISMMNRGDTPRMDPSPLKIILDKRDELIKHIYKFNNIKPNEGSYKTLRF